MREVESWDPAADGFPKPVDIFAMNEHSTPSMPAEEIMKFIGLPSTAFEPTVHIPVFLARWRYAVAREMMKAREAKP